MALWASTSFPEGDRHTVYPQSGVLQKMTLHSCDFIGEPSQETLPRQIGKWDGKEKPAIMPVTAWGTQICSGGLGDTAIGPPLSSRIYSTRASIPPHQSQGIHSLQGMWILWPARSALCTHPGHKMSPGRGVVLTFWNFYHCVDHCRSWEIKGVLTTPIVESFPILTQLLCLPVFLCVSVSAFYLTVEKI